MAERHSTGARSANNGPCTVNRGKIVREATSTTRPPSPGA